MNNDAEDKQSQPDLLENDDLSMEGYDKPVKKARNILFAIGAIQLIGIFLAPKEPGIERTTVIVASILLAIMFVILALWTSRKPFDAIITGLIVYTALILLNMYFDPATILKGVIFKVVIYVLLITALSNARDVQKWKDSLRKK